jgi:hypothetical protein
MLALVPAELSDANNQADVWLSDGNLSEEVDSVGFPTGIQEPTWLRRRQVSGKVNEKRRAKRNGNVKS